LSCVVAVVVVAQVRRELVLYHSTRTAGFRIAIVGSGKQYALSHINGKFGPLSMFDLHVGAKLVILGKPCTLMQASLETGDWLDGCARHLRALKTRLLGELDKYGRPCATKLLPSGRYPGVRGDGSKGGEYVPIRDGKAKGHVCLSELIRDIEHLGATLAEERPELAMRIIHSA